MNDVPLFDDLSPPAGQAERIPIAVPTREELLVQLEDIAREAQGWIGYADVHLTGLARFMSRTALVCEQTRAFLGAREP